MDAVSLALMQYYASKNSEQTLSGDVVSFIGKTATKVESLTAAVTPIQDLHGYDNPWPAGGGKQLIPYPYVQDTKTTQGITFTANSDGSIRVVSTGTGTSRGFFDLQTGNSGAFVLEAGTYTISGGNANIAVTCVKVPNTSFISSKKRPDTGTLEEDTTVACYLSCDSSIEYDVTIYPQLEKGSSATSYAPYSNICPITGWTGANVYVSPTQDVADATVYPVTWQTEAGTVYGGTVDVVSGVLTVDKRYLTFSSGATLYGNYGDDNAPLYYMSFPTAPAIKRAVFSTDDSKLQCNYFTFISTPGDQSMKDCEIRTRGTDTPDRIYFRWDSATDASSINAALANTPLQVIADLQSPLTYQLTPQEVTALLGQNYVWSDAGDVIAVVKGAAGPDGDRSVSRSILTYLIRSPQRKRRP